MPTPTTLAHASRQIDRVKQYLSGLDQRYEAIQVSCPQVTLNKGLAALHASMVDLSHQEGPHELIELPQEGQAAVAKATEALHQVTDQIALLRSCAEHIKSGTPLDVTSGLAMAARIVRSGSLNGAAVEASATLRFLQDNLDLAEKRLEVLRDKSFRIANAVEVANLKNRIRFLVGLTHLSRMTPTSVVNVDAVEATIAANNKELDELVARHQSYYSKNSPAK